jgi:hypothetical protein
MDGFYDFVKANDLQGRPVTSSSGLTVWQWKIPVKATSWTSTTTQWKHGLGRLRRRQLEVARLLREDLWTHRQAVINGECGGYESNATLRPDVKGLTRDGAFSRTPTSAGPTS